MLTWQHLKPFNTLVYHSHNDINNNSTYTNTNTIQANSVISDMNGLFISDFGSWRHKERDTILTMLTILSDSTPNVWHILWCLRSQFISAGQDPKNLTAAATVETSTLCMNGLISTDSSSKSSNSQDHLSWAWCHPHSSPISCLSVYYDNGDCHILCVRE